MTRNYFQNSSVVGPALHFSLLLVPLVMNCFYVVYSMTGLILEGKDKLNWSIEAPSVGLWVLAGMLVFCAFVVLYTRWRGGDKWHPLVISSVGHIVLSVILTLMIFINVYM